MGGEKSQGPVEPANAACLQRAQIPQHPVPLACIPPPRSTHRHFTGPPSCVRPGVVPRRRSEGTATGCLRLSGGGPVTGSPPPPSTLRTESQPCLPLALAGHLPPAALRTPHGQDPGPQVPAETVGPLNADI